MNLRPAVIIGALLPLAADAGTMNPVAVTNNGIEICVRPSSFGAIKVRDLATDTYLARFDNLLTMVPSFATNAVAKSCGLKDGAIEIAYASPGLADGRLTIAPALRGFLLNAAFTPREDATVNRLELVYNAASFGGFHTMNHLVARNGTPNQVPEVLLADDRFEAHTLSDYGYLSPRPTAMAFADYLDSAARIGAIVQFANCFGVRNDCGIGERRMLAEDFEMVRKHMDARGADSASCGKGVGEWCAKQNLAELVGWCAK